MERPRVALVYPTPASFVLQDAEILGERFRVRRLHYRHRRDLARLALAVTRSDLVVSWFALGHAAAAVRIARRLRRRSVVIAGGYDVARVPDVGYGVALNPRRVPRIRQALEGADLVLAVSESTRRQVRAIVDREVRVVYNGVDTDRFHPGGRRRRQVLTVAGVGWEGHFRVKRLDLVLEVARRLPDVPFLLVGPLGAGWASKLRALAPPNASVLGEQRGEDLERLYRETAVYLQPSAHESFGMAVAEAMASGCVPVVSDRYALPEVVGDAGIVVPYGDAAATAEAVARALDSPLGPRARARVVERFSRERRREGLLSAIESLL